MILIVDDKPENLYSLKALLQLHAYDVDTASSGEEALKKILRADYELIILDVQMPEMDGYEVAEAITGYSKTKNTPIIFLSAVNLNKRFITKGYASGAVDYVTKPFDPDLLMLKVKTFCRLHAQTVELKKMQGVLREEIETRKNTQKALEEANLLLEDKVAERTKELLQSNKQLESSNAELQQYASVASHDLQEPLRKIIIFTNIIREKYIAECPDAETYLAKVTSASERMRTLIDDLLNYSKLSVSSHFTWTSLQDVLSETLVDLELSIREKDAVISSNGLPFAEVIPGQIRQVFQNIIGNALKFSKADVPPRIDIHGELTAEKSFDSPATARGSYLRISIQDNGIGFNEVFLEKIFTLFQRLHGRSEYEGTGIGLAIVRKIIEKHNGILTAKSHEDEGASFVFVIPVHQTSEPAQSLAD